MGKQGSPRTLPGGATGSGSGPVPHRRPRPTTGSPTSLRVTGTVGVGPGVPEMDRRVSSTSGRSGTTYRQEQDRFLSVSVTGVRRGTYGCGRPRLRSPGTRPGLRGVWSRSLSDIHQSGRRNLFGQFRSLYDPRHGRTGGVGETWGVVTSHVAGLVTDRCFVPL